jgi:hypothetical protein
VCEWVLRGCVLFQLLFVGRSLRVRLSLSEVRVYLTGPVGVSSVLGRCWKDCSWWVRRINEDTVAINCQVHSADMGRFVRFLLTAAIVLSLAVVDISAFNTLHRASFAPRQRVLNKVSVNQHLNAQRGMHTATGSSSALQFSATNGLMRSTASRSSSALEASTTVDAAPGHQQHQQQFTKSMPSKTLKKLLPLGAMLFFILFNYTILRDTKDVLVVCAPGGGAEIIPFLKTYVNLPSAIGFTFLYSYLCSQMSSEKVFYVLISSFLAFFGAFAGFICKF